VSDLARSGLPMVVLTRNLADPESQRWLAERAQVTIATPESLAADVADAVGLIAVWPVTVDKAVLDAAPSLRVIATVTAGTEHIDMNAAAARGVEVVSGVGAAPDAVVEWALWAMLGLSRKFTFAARRFDDGRWDWSNRLADGPSRELSGQTLGIVGLGHIGRKLAEAVRLAFGMSVIAFDPYAPQVDGITLVSLEDLLDASDVVSLNLPLTDQTRSMFGRDELRRIGPNGILLNASRGGVVDEAAVIEALQAGELGAAAFDVFAAEPPKPDLVADLLATGRVLLTPHAAGVSSQAMVALNRRAVEAVVECLRSPRPQ
jgi:phosphoglycerate dehydrogenase-like enzyme